MRIRMDARAAASRQWSALAAIVLLVSGGAALADEDGAPLVTCRALLAHGRALVDVAAEHLFPEEQARLIKLGLVGRVRMEVTLLRRQPFWFDAVLAHEEREVVLRSAERRVELERVALRGEQRLEE